MLSRVLACCLLAISAAAADPPAPGADPQPGPSAPADPQPVPSAPAAEMIAIADDGVASGVAGGLGADSEDDAQGQASQSSGSPMTATFGGGVSGSLTIKKTSDYVEWKSTKITVPASLIAEVCGATTDPDSIDFMYHIHDKWTSTTSDYGTGSDCGGSFTGGHWDPTAACGGASGNAVCVTCGTKGVNYTCDKDNFEKDSVMQYRYLTPDAFGAGGTTCEFGDLSGMYGFLPGSEKSSDTTIKSSDTRKAKMSATYGSITPDTVSADCKYNQLFRNYDKDPGFLLASASGPLDQLVGKSIVYHCANGYENFGARIFCAKLV